MRIHNGWVCWVFAALLLAGCANRYRVTLTNNNQMTTRSKPRLSQSKTDFEFKDARGEKVSIPVIKVKSIEPL